MCLSVPGKIVNILDEDGLRMADVDFGGAIRKVCIEWVPEAGKGDYVLAHVGTALTVLDEQSALESLAAFDEINEKLKEEEELNL